MGAIRSERLIAPYKIYLTIVILSVIILLSERHLCYEERRREIGAFCIFAGPCLPIGREIPAKPAAKSRISPLTRKLGRVE